MKQINNEDLFKRNKSGRINTSNMHAFFGKKYGKLTIIGKSTEVAKSSKGHNVLLLDFKCDCGNIVTKKASEVIKKEGTRSCGCLIKEVGIKTGEKRRIKQVTPGETFGYVTVINEIEGSKPREVLTKCICGNEKVVSVNYLISNKSYMFSCGCKKHIKDKEVGEKNIKNVVKVGDVCHYLTVTKIDLKIYVGKDKKEVRACEVKCKCGKEYIIRVDYIVKGYSKSCGCYMAEAASKRFTKHNLHNTTEYRILSSMKQRCFNSKDNNYKHYGERGITICERWMKPAPEGFYNFLADMGKRPSQYHSIDRINVEGDYEPSNCKWATSKEQATNRRIRKCPHCGISIMGPNYTRYHGDNCKSRIQS